MNKPIYVLLLNKMGELNTQSNLISYLKEQNINQEYDQFDFRYDDPKQISNNLFNKILQNAPIESTIIISHMDLLGTTIYKALKKLDLIIKKNISLYILENKFEINKDSYILFSYLCKIYFNQKEKHNKNNNINKPRKKYKTRKSMFSKKKKKIYALLEQGYNTAQIIGQIGIGTRQALEHYLKREAKLLQSKNKNKQKSKSYINLYPTSLPESGTYINKK